MSVASTSGLTIMKKNSLLVSNYSLLFRLFEALSSRHKRFSTALKFSPEVEVEEPGVLIRQDRSTGDVKKYLMSVASTNGLTILKKNSLLVSKPSRRFRRSSISLILNISFFSYFLSEVKYSYYR